MVEVPEAYRTFTGSTRSAAATSWRRREWRSRARACSTAPRASAASTAGHALRASAAATSGGPCGFGRPDPRDHLVAPPTPLLLAGRGSRPYARLHLLGMPAH